MSLAKVRQAWAARGLCWICRQALPSEPGQRGMRQAHTECRRALEKFKVPVAVIRERGPQAGAWEA